MRVFKVAAKKLNRLAAPFTLIQLKTRRLTTH